MAEMLTPTFNLLTFEEYLDYDDGTEIRYELENGVLLEMPPESPLNLAIVRFLIVELAKHLSLSLIAHNTEVEVSGRRATCRLPDLLVHSEESLAALAGTTRATITQAMPPPALAIEVVSPGATNRVRDYRYKHTEYAARGIAEYWIIDPQEQLIVVCQWVDGQYEDRVFRGTERLQSQVVPPLQLTVEQILTAGELG